MGSFDGFSGGSLFRFAASAGDFSILSGFDHDNSAPLRIARIRAAPPMDHRSARQAPVLRTSRCPLPRRGEKIDSRATPLQASESSRARRPPRATAPIPAPSPILFRLYFPALPRNHYRIAAASA
jgi:hypothetical protein